MTALSTQKEELLLACAEMMNTQLDEYKRQAMADIIAMSQATSDELESKVKQYKQWVKELEDRLNEYELLIAQHNELHTTMPKLEKDIQAHRLKIDLAQHTEDFVMQIVDNVVATNEVEHEVLMMRVEKLEEEMESMQQRESRLSVLKSPGIDKTLKSMHNQSDAW